MHHCGGRWQKLTLCFVRPPPSPGFPVPRLFCFCDVHDENDMCAPSPMTRAPQPRRNTRDTDVREIVGYFFSLNCHHPPPLPDHVPRFVSATYLPTFALSHGAHEILTLFSVRSGWSGWLVQHTYGDICRCLSIPHRTEQPGRFYVRFALTKYNGRKMCCKQGNVSSLCWEKFSIVWCQ